MDRIDNRVLLKSVASILTRKQVQEKNGDNENLFCNLPIFVNKRITSLSQEFDVSSSLPSEDGYFVFSEENKFNISLQYILFYVNSIVGKVLLLLKDDNTGYKKSISRNELSLLPIPIAKEGYQYYFEKIQEIISYYNDRLSQKEDRFMKLQRSIFIEVRDGLSIELLSQEFIGQFGVNIIEEWKSLCDKHAKSSQLYSKVFQDLIAPDNIIMNQLKKLRIIISEYTLLKNDVANK